MELTLVPRRHMEPSPRAQLPFMASRSRCLTATPSQRVRLAAGLVVRRRADIYRAKLVPNNFPDKHMSSNVADVRIHRNNPLTSAEEIKKSRKYVMRADTCYPHIVSNNWMIRGFVHGINTPKVR